MTPNPGIYNLVSVYGQRCFTYTLSHLPLFYIILKQIPKTQFIIKLSNCFKMLFFSPQIKVGLNELLWEILDLSEKFLY